MVRVRRVVLVLSRALTSLFRFPHRYSPGTPRPCAKNEPSTFDISKEDDLSHLFSFANEKMARYLADKISNWDTSSVTSLHRTFAESHVNSDISEWNTHLVRDMSYLFRGTFYEFSFVQHSNIRAKNNAGNQHFDRNLGSWDTSKVTSLRSAFDSAKSFRGIGLTSWNVAAVTDFRDAFRNTSSISNCTKRAIRSLWFSNKHFFRVYGSHHEDMPAYTAKCSDDDKDATMLSFANTDEDVLETRENLARVHVHLSATMNVTTHDISIVGAASVKNMTRLNDTLVSMLVRIHHELHRRDYNIWFQVKSTSSRYESNVLRLRYVFERLLSKKQKYSCLTSHIEHTAGTSEHVRQYVFSVLRLDIRLERSVTRYRFHLCCSRNL